MLNNEKKKTFLEFIEDTYGEQEPNVSGTDKELFSSEWLSVIDRNGYIFAHEVKGNGKSVSVLPYRYNNDSIEFLLRKEKCPCWGSESSLCSVTGMIEGEEDVIETAIRELKEETGYTVTADDLIFCGTCRTNKACDTEVSLFSVDLTDKEATEAEGDGSENEAAAENLWLPDISKCVDPLVFITYYKLNSQEKL